MLAIDVPAQREVVVASAAPKGGKAYIGPAIFICVLLPPSVGAVTCGSRVPGGNELFLIVLLLRIIWFIVRSLCLSW